MINESIERPPAEVVQGFRSLLSYDSITCAISDCMGRFNAMTSDMKPLFEGIRIVGTAITVKTLAADLAAAFKAIDVCQPGDIVVIGGGIFPADNNSGHRLIHPMHATDLRYHGFLIDHF